MRARLVTLVLVAIAVFGIARFAAAGPERSEVCHATGRGEYIYLYTSAASHFVHWNDHFGLDWPSCMALNN